MNSKTRKRPGIGDKGLKGKKRQTSYKIAGAIKKRMMRQIVEDNYGMKGKSRWAQEALISFLEDRSWKDQVLDGEMNKSNDQKDIIYLDDEVRDQLNMHVEEVYEYAREEKKKGRRQDMLDQLDIAPSSILRSAILWRLNPLLHMTIPECPKEQQEDVTDMSISPGNASLSN